MSELRDRIAEAIAKADQDWCSDNPLYEDMADAVIAALGLKRASRPSDYGYVNYPPGYQYVTEWIADD